jgi:hypothetical protein
MDVAAVSNPAIGMIQQCCRISFDLRKGRAKCVLTLSSAIRRGYSRDVAQTAFANAAAAQGLERAQPILLVSCLGRP